MSDMFVYSYITLSLLVIEITTIICPAFLLLQRLAQCILTIINAFVPKLLFSTRTKMSIFKTPYPPPFVSIHSQK